MTIRPYRPADRDRLRQICRETAAKPFQRTGRTLEAVTLIYNDYFTAYEPDHIFVLADESDRAVGYILCAADYRGFVHRYRTTYLRWCCAQRQIRRRACWAICGAWAKSKTGRCTSTWIYCRPISGRGGVHG